MNLKSSRGRAPGATLDIGAVSRRTRLPASTLRYWESRGLLAPAGRHGLRRQYHEGCLEQIAFIRLAQAAGFRLDEIAAMVRPGRRPAVDRRALLAKADELDQTLRRLTAMRDGLRHSAACPAPDHFACPKFRALLEAALDGGLADGRKR